MKTKLILEVEVDTDESGWIWDSLGGSKKINGVLVEKISMNKNQEFNKVEYWKYIDMQEEGYKV